MPWDVLEDAIPYLQREAENIFITTDLLRHGVDLRCHLPDDQACIVINFDLPIRLELYLHRIGLLFRRFAQKGGVAISLVTAKDVPMMKEIEVHYHTQINELPKNVAAHL